MLYKTYSILLTPSFFSTNPIMVTVMATSFTSLINSLVFRMDKNDRHFGYFVGSFVEPSVT